MTEPPVVTRLDGPVATVELNRADRLNPLDEPTRAALLAALTNAAADDAVLAVVLTGAGRAFCVGQDLAPVAELDDAHDTVSRTYNPLIHALRACAKLVVAAVNGPAVGAGMGLALACDIVVMAESASMSCAFGRMALVPDSGTAWLLTRRLGHQRAFALATTGRKITGAEAVTMASPTRPQPTTNSCRPRPSALPTSRRARPRRSPSPSSCWSGPPTRTWPRCSSRRRWPRASRRQPRTMSASAPRS